MAVNVPPWHTPHCSCGIVVLPIINIIIIIGVNIAFQILHIVGHFYFAFPPLKQFHNADVHRE